MHYFKKNRGKIHTSQEQLHILHNKEFKVFASRISI